MLDKGESKALSRLAGSLPKRVFDAHAHFYPKIARYGHPAELAGAQSEGNVGVDDYIESVRDIYGREEIRVNVIPFVPKAGCGGATVEWCDISNAFVLAELKAHPGCVGEVFAAPWMSHGEIAAYFTDERLRGIKCYHTACARPDSFNADIAEYLPEGAWEYANERGLAITLHMVKEGSLSDKENLAYITEHLAAYPRATLILAHCARGFAQHTATEAIGALERFENVVFDMAAVCEPYVMYKIVERFGAKRLLWGSDFDISEMRGRCVTLGEGFYWLYQQDIPGNQCHRVLIESLTALFQAADMLKLGEGDMDDIFYMNSARLFRAR